MDDDTLRQRFEKILVRRAERLGIPLEQARNISHDTPLFRQAAEELASTENIPADVILERGNRRLADVSFPTPECLSVDDVTDYAATGTLSDAQRVHVDGCDTCATLVATVAPSEERLGDFTAELRRMLQQPADVPSDLSETVMPPVPVMRRSVAKEWRQRILAPVPAFAGAFAAMLVGFLLFQNSPGGRSAERVDVATAGRATTAAERLLRDEVAALQSSVTAATQAAARAEAAAKEIQKAQTAMAANEARTTKALVASLEEYKKLAFGAAMAPQLVFWGDPGRQFKKGDVIRLTAEGRRKEQELLVENPQALNEAKGDFVRSMREIGLQPATVGTPSASPAPLK